MRTNFCDFQKVPSTFPVSRSLSRRGNSERKTERPLLAGNQCPALMIFWFLLSTCNQGAMEYRISSNNSRPSIYRLPRIIAPPPPPPTPSCHLLFSLSLPVRVKLKWSLMRENSSVTIQALTPRILTLKSNQGSKFGALKMRTSSLFDFFYLMAK